MLTSLRVSNFKAFGEELQEIPIRPITLIFGPNSGGKSSAIHSLLLAHHLANTGDVDVHRTQLGGDAVDLGGFQRYVYRRTPENRVQLELSLSLRDVPSYLLRQWAETEEEKGRVYLEPENYPITELFKDPLQSPIRGCSGDSKITLTLELGQRLREKRQSRRRNLPERGELEYPTGELNTIGEPNLVGVDVEVDGSQLLRLRQGPKSASQQSPYHVKQFNSDHTIVRALIAHRYEDALKDSLSSPYDSADQWAVEDMLREAANAARRVRHISEQGIFPDLSFTANVAIYESALSAGDDLVENINILERQFSWTDPNPRLSNRYDLRFFFLQLIEHYSKRVVALAKNALGRLRYLGPLRSYPDRHPQNNQKNDADWYAGGGHVWELLRDDADVREQVNRWLSGGDDGEQRLQTPYKIKPRRFLTDETLEQELPERIAESMKHMLADVLGEQMELGIGSLDELSRLIQESSHSLFRNIDQAVPELKQIISSSVDTEELVREWIDEITDQSDGLQDLTLVDQRTRTPVSHRDVGIGISQLLPVLTYAYAYEDRLVALEQPELHLHPAVQAELGDLFIETALGEQGNQFIIETHSEHLILRLLRRIRETSSGELEDERFALTTDDVAVLYAEPTRSGTVIHHLRITPDGDFANRWPDGFFTEREKELF